MYPSTRRAAIVANLQRLLKNSPLQTRRSFYQALAFVLTFITYTTYHINKRPFSVVKSVLSPNCDVTTINNTCQPWSPFSGNQQDKRLFGLLDCTFMISYSFALFASGYLAENTNLRIFLSCGMFMTGVSSALFGMADYLEIHSVIYFFAMQVLAGITQSTGLPSVTEAIGMWIPIGKTGIIFGVWSFHSFLGNIIGNALSGILLKYGWGMTFFVPAALIIGNSTIVYLFLIPDPSIVNICIAENTAESSKETLFTSSLSKKENENNEKIDLLETREQEPDGINIRTAFKIPGVLEYAFCTFFVKLVLYTFFFWLPYMINAIEDVDPTQAAYRASIYDLGCGIGGILAGIIYDFTDTPAIINVIMLLCGAPIMFLLFLPGNDVIMFAVYTFLSGCFIGGPFILISSTVAKRLSSLHSCATPNTKAIAILTAIFDGFGSIGASFGPLLTGIIQEWRNSWTDVSYLLMFCVLVAALILARQCFNEIFMIISKYSRGIYSNYDRNFGSDEIDKLIEDIDK